MVRNYLLTLSAHVKHMKPIYLHMLSPLQLIIFFHSHAKTVFCFLMIFVGKLTMLSELRKVDVMIRRYYLFFVDVISVITSRKTSPREKLRTVDDEED